MHTIVLLVLSRILRLGVISVNIDQSIQNECLLTGQRKNNNKNLLDLHIDTHTSFSSWYPQFSH